VALDGDGCRLLVDLDEGYPFLQVYAPAGGDFCCLEPMTAPTNALVTGDHATARAGDRYHAAFSVRAQPRRPRG
jgi:galactose mutarotase-like enzyme